jgi:hypothetical protein
MKTSKLDVTLTHLHISQEVGQHSYSDPTASELANFLNTLILEQTQQLYFKDNFPFVMSEYLNIYGSFFVHVACILLSPDT